MNAAYLYAQLEIADEINNARRTCWDRYYENLKPLAQAGKIELPYVPEECVHNAHMFYIKAKNIEERSALIEYLKEHGVHSVFHYIPLHTEEAWLLPFGGQPLRIHVYISDSIRQLRVMPHRTDERHLRKDRRQLAIALLTHSLTQARRRCLQPRSFFPKAIAPKPLLAAPLFFQAASQPLLAAS